MSMFEDTARFHPHDHSSVVAAAFACPWCLATAGLLTVVSTTTPSVVCECGPCAKEWLVHLDGRQLMRMHFAPPGRCEVRWFPMRRVASPRVNWAGW